MDFLEETVYERKFKTKCNEVQFLHNVDIEIWQRNVLKSTSARRVQVLALNSYVSKITNFLI